MAGQGGGIVRPSRYAREEPSAVQLPPDDDRGVDVCSESAVVYGRNVGCSRLRLRKLRLWRAKGAGLSGLLATLVKNPLRVQLPPDDDRGVDVCSESAVVYGRNVGCSRLRLRKLRLWRAKGAGLSGLLATLVKNPLRVQLPPDDDRGVDVCSESAVVYGRNVGCSRLRLRKLRLWRAKGAGLSGLLATLVKNPLRVQLPPNGDRGVFVCNGFGNDFGRDVGCRGGI